MWMSQQRMSSSSWALRREAHSKQMVMLLMTMIWQVQQITQPGAHAAELAAAGRALGRRAPAAKHSSSSSSLSTHSRALIRQQQATQQLGQTATQQLGQTATQQLGQTATQQLGQTATQQLQQRQLA
jgi:hypothetical protein